MTIKKNNPRVLDKVINDLDNLIYNQSKYLNKIPKDGFEKGFLNGIKWARKLIEKTNWDVWKDIKEYVENFDDINDAFDWLNENDLLSEFKNKIDFYNIPKYWDAYKIWANI